MALWSSLFGKSGKTNLTRPSLTLFYLLVGTFLLTLVPHIEQLPIWISVCVVAALAIRCFLEFYRLPLPSTTFSSIVALCLLIGIMLQFNTMMGRDAGIAFMAGLLAVKFYEIRTPRDIAVIIFSSFFVVMSALLYSQAFELFVYCLIMMWILTALLLRVQLGDQPEDQLLRMLKNSGFILLQALPLMLVLFLFFPRFTGKLQMNLNESPLGLTDTVEPGSIAKLSKNDATAFYAKLSGQAIPLVETMYWRALVLWDYRNGAWKVGIMDQNQTFAPAVKGSVVVQDIFIDPHFKRWLFALDHAVTKATNSNENSEWSTLYVGEIIQLTSQRGQINHKQRYQVSSAIDPQPGEHLPSDQRYAALRLPPVRPASEDDKGHAGDRIDPSVKEFSDKLWKEHPNPQAYSTAVLSYFQRTGFKYSAEPDMAPPGTDWMAFFLFKSKNGFCEHFASAYAVLMRLQGVPARLVVGYLGGRLNPYDQCYIVEQSNAHAWNEIWIDDAVQTGRLKPGETVGIWKRIDPVATVAAGDGPSAGANGSPGEETLSFQVANHRLSVSSSYLPAWMRSAVVDFQMRRQQMEANWDELVFSFDPEAQERLARKIGMGLNSWVSMALACVLAIAISIYVLRRWMGQRPVVTPVEKLYASFCRLMAQRGIPRAVWEGPLAYTNRTAEAFPDRKEAIRSLGRIVAYSRYGPEPVAPTAVQDLQTLLASLQPPPPAPALAPNESR